ncbi:extracellular fatty acid-binding protein [Pogona vitticeps]
MRVWLVGLGLAFLAIIRADDLDNLEHEKLQGVWHGVALASDCEMVLKHRDDMKIVTATLTKLEDGGVTVASNMPTPHGCKHFEMTFRKREDGKLVHECEWGTKIVDALKTDYSNYGLVNFAKFKGGQKICNIITLFARVPVLTEENAEMIKSAAKEAGIAEENIIIFPQEMACQS